MRASEVVVVVRGWGDCREGIERKREGESEEEMDGGGRRDVRKAAGRRSVLWSDWERTEPQERGIEV